MIGKNTSISSKDIQFPIVSIHLSLLILILTVLASAHADVVDNGDGNFTVSGNFVPALPYVASGGADATPTITVDGLTDLLYVDNVNNFFKINADNYTVDVQAGALIRNAGLGNIFISTVGGSLTKYSIAGSLYFSGSGISAYLAGAPRWEIEVSGLLKNTSVNQLAIGQGGDDKFILQPTGHLWVVGASIISAIEFRGGNDEFIINGGTLDLPNPVDFGSGNDRLELNAAPTGTAEMRGGSGTDTVQLNNSGSYSLTALASGWEQLEMNGAAWTLSGFTANTFSGGVALNAGNLTLDITGGDTTISGVVSGAGNLTKAGSGTLTLTGANTYGGLTTINAGVLAVNGSLAGPVTVGAAGTLGGSGTVGNVTVNGTLAPGNSIGTINTGSIAFNAGSVYTVEVDAAGNSDRTNVTGTVSLGGATLNVLAENGSYALATDYLIVDNDGVDAVSGVFGNLTSNLVFLDPSVNYAGGTGNDVILTMTRNDVTFANVATTPNQAAVANALEQMAPGATGDTQTVITAVTGLSAEGARSAYDQMGGAGLAAFYESDLSAATHTLRTISGRLASLRADTATTTLSRWDTGPLLASNDALPTTDAGRLLFGLGNAGSLTPEADWGVWGRGLGVWGDRDGRDVAEQYDYRITGATLGLDRRLGEAMVAGISVGYADAELDYDQLEDSGTSRGWETALYGAWMQGPWYVDAMAAYARNDYDTKRYLAFGGIDRVAEGDFNGDVWSAYLESGGTFDWQGLILQPLASLQVVYMDYDSYTETGAGALNLVVDDGDATSVMGSVGLRVAKVIAGPDGGQVVPEARVRWAHEFSHDERVISAGFAGAPSGAGGFKVEGDDPVRNWLVLGCGLTALVNDAVGVYLNYDAAIGDDALDQAFSVGLRIMW